MKRQIGDPPKHHLEFAIDHSRKKNHFLEALLIKFGSNENRYVPLFVLMRVFFNVGQPYGSQLGKNAIYNR